MYPSHYNNGGSSYREKALNNIGIVCEQCGYSNVDALEVHHIDRNRTNNSIDNLKVLCANCHRLLHKHLRA